MNKCTDCHHKKENHNKESFCTEDLTCMCQEFKGLILDEIENNKNEAVTIKERCILLLTGYPHLRNSTEKTFCKAYKGLWHNFWPSNKTVYDIEKFKEMPHDDSINATKRQIKANGLPTFDENILVHQKRKFIAYMEIALEQ